MHIHDSVLLAEMQLLAEDGEEEGAAGDGGGYAWPCRCGGAFHLLADDVALVGGGEGGDGAAAGGECEWVVPCSTCSLHIRVHLHGGGDSAG